MYVTHKYDMGDVKRLAKKYPSVTKDVMEMQVTEAVNLLEAAVVKETPYGAGPIHLRDTIHGKVHTMGMQVSGMVGTPLEHGEPVELGTKPHWPPIGPIQHWVEGKLHVPANESKSVAFLIARKIARKGTKGVRMFGKAFDDNRSKIMNILGRIPEKIVRRVMK